MHPKPASRDSPRGHMGAVKGQREELAAKIMGQRGGEAERAARLVALLPLPGKSGHTPPPAGPRATLLPNSRGNTFLRKRKKGRGRGGGETAYLGYFHKMAQDFCPYF